MMTFGYLRFPRILSIINARHQEQDAPILFIISWHRRGATKRDSRAALPMRPVGQILQNDRPILQDDAPAEAWYGLQSTVYC